MTLTSHLGLILLQEIQRVLHLSVVDLDVELEMTRHSATLQYHREMVGLIFRRPDQVQSKLVIIDFIERLIDDRLVEVSLAAFIRQQSLQMLIVLRADLLVAGVPVLTEQLIEKETVLHCKHLLIQQLVKLILILLLHLRKLYLPLNQRQRIRNQLTQIRHILLLNNLLISFDQHQ